MRESIRKIVSRFRRDKGSVSPAASKGSVSPATTKVSALPLQHKASVSPAASKGSVSPEAGKVSALPLHRKARVSPATTTASVLPLQRKATSSPAPSKKKTSRNRRPPDETGETVWLRPSRFRSLTLTEADVSALADPSAIPGVFKIRLAKHARARRDAGTLIVQRYGGRGYIVPRRKAKPNVFTFIAYDEGQIVGTVGLGVDSEKGLSADEIYRAEIDQLRAKGWRVCEFTRLAVDRTAASKPVLAGLFQTAYLYAKLCRCTHAVIEVNPRHVAFYGRALKFEPIGPERMNKRVNAPAVLLCASFKTIAHDLKKYAGKTPAPGAKRTLFYYGFPPKEEIGVLTRLRKRVPAH